MKTRKLLHPLALITILVICSNCSIFKKSADNGPFTLRYKFSPGQEFVVSSEVKSDFVTEQMGQSMTVDMGSKTVLGFKVLSQEEDNFSLEMEFAGMEQTVDSPMGGGETDYSQLLGKKTRFSVGGTGETDNLEGFEELPVITTASGETVTGEMYEQVVGGTFSKLPEEPVKFGDSWDDSFSRDMPYGGGTLKTEAQFTYLVSEKVNVEGEDCLKIEITGSAKTSGTFEQQGMLIDLDRTSTSTGHMYFAYKKGMFISMEISSKTEGIVNIESMGMEVPQTINSTAKTTVEFK